MWCRILLRIFWMEGHRVFDWYQDKRLQTRQDSKEGYFAKTSTAGLWNSVQDKQCLIVMVRWELCITVCRQHSSSTSLLNCRSTVQLVRHKQWKGLDLKLSPEELYWMLRVWLRTVTIQAVLRNFYFLDMILSTQVEQNQCQTPISICLRAVHEKQCRRQLSKFTRPTTEPESMDIKMSSTI